MRLLRTRRAQLCSRWAMKAAASAPTARSSACRFVPVAATDTTGAGDTFIAGFIAGLAHDLPLEACARLGCRVAAFAVTGPGAYPRIPRVKDATELLQEVTT